VSEKGRGKEIKKEREKIDSMKKTELGEKNVRP